MKKRDELSPVDDAHASMEERILEFIRRGSADEAEFAALALKLHQFQRARNEPYEKYCRARGGNDPETYQQIPSVPQNAFKHAALRCFPEEEVTATFRTSGTTGEGFGRHHFRSTRIYDESILRGWDWFGLPVLPQIIFTLPPHDAPHSSLSHMMGVLRARSADSQCFCISRDGTIDVEPLRAACHPEGREAQRNGVEGSRGANPHFSETPRNPSTSLRCAQDDRPVCVIGTALAFLNLFEPGEKFVLPQGSIAMETGGYKGSGRVLEKEELYELFETFLGIASDNVFNEYSMTEISSQFYTRGLGRVHRAPPWTRVLVIDPETGNEVGLGAMGMIRIFDLANVGSVLAVQTEDLAVKRADGFELLGRSPTALPRGCSRSADELLARR